MKRIPAVVSHKHKIVLVTGAAGFIGFHLAMALSKDNRTTVIGMDNFNDYYDTRLKKVINYTCLTFNMFNLFTSNIFKYKILFIIYLLNNINYRVFTTRVFTTTF